MGFLSSQPKKRVYADDEENEMPEPTQFAFNEHEWPPTPPKKPKVIASASAPAASHTLASKGKPLASTSTSSSSSSSRSFVNTAGSGSWSNGSKAVSVNSKSVTGPLSRKPSIVLGSKPSFSSSSSRGATISSNNNNTTTASSKLAPIFAKPGTSSSSSGHKPMPWAPRAQGSAMAAPVASTSGASTSSTVPKKRVMPWDELLQSGSSSHATGSSSSKSSNYHIVGGEESKVGRSNMLTSTAIDIKQKVTLSSEQQMVLEMVLQGKNIFFTGSAGTGKSVLLREIITSLKRKHKGSADAVAVTASTGMAACNIGGTTIHSFAGIGLGIDPVELLIGKIKKNRVAHAKWQRVKVLVIDEVSMVDGILFDKLSAIGAALKRKAGTRDAPFGGIQLVVTGDFFQLPPVSKGPASFAFEAQSWSKAIQHTVNLTQVFRQKDTRFIDMLNEMRFGTLTAQSIAEFKRLARDPKYTDGIDPTELFPMRQEVERSNEARLRSLPGEPHDFRSEDWPSELSSSSSYGSKNTYLSNFMAPEKLVLKVGAQVMLIKNLDTDLVNGTVGKVVGFGHPDMDGDDDEGDDPGASEAARLRKQKLMLEKIAAGKVEERPLIEWRTPSGVLIRLMDREEFKVEDAKGQKLASRKQYPIILAWAMSIHKSQGQTLARVKVDLGRVFEKGQSYVALSRATSLEGLQILRFTPDKVAAHPKVVQWSKTLQVLDTGA